MTGYSLRVRFCVTGTWGLWFVILSLFMEWCADIYVVELQLHSHNGSSQVTIRYLMSVRNEHARPKSNPKSTGRKLHSHQGNLWNTSQNLHSKRLLASHCNDWIHMNCLCNDKPGSSSEVGACVMLELRQEQFLLVGRRNVKGLVHCIKTLTLTFTLYRFVIWLTFSSKSRSYEVTNWNASLPVWYHTLTWCTTC